MKENKNKLIDILNQSLNAELLAFQNYFFHSTILKELHCNKLAEKWKEEAQEELDHANIFIKRINELKGAPIYPETYKLNIGKGIVEILTNDLELEIKGRKIYQDAITFCDSIQDFYTKDLFEEIIIKEESHIIFLEKQLEIIQSIGLENYIINQM